MAKSEDNSGDLILDWIDLHRDCIELGRLLQAADPWQGACKGIVGVARGGLVPAALVARVLGINFIHTVCATSYDDARQRGPVRVLSSPEGLADGHGWLIVDDVADTGGTVRAIRDLLPAAYFASVFVKPDGREHVDNYVRAVSQQTWIRFPWDRNPEDMRHERG